MYPSQTKPAQRSAVVSALASSGITNNAYHALVSVNIGQYAASNSQCNFNELRTETTAKYWPILANTPHSAVGDRAVGDRAAVDCVVGDRVVGDRAAVDCVVGVGGGVGPRGG